MDTGKVVPDLTVTPAEHQALSAWAAKGAQRLLPLYEAHHPNDRRPHNATHGAALFAAGMLPPGTSQKVARACQTAAQETAEKSARAVATAALHCIKLTEKPGYAFLITEQIATALRAVGTSEETIHAATERHQNDCPVAFTIDLNQTADTKLPN